MCLSANIGADFNIDSYGLSLDRSVSDLHHFLFVEGDKKTKFDTFIYHTFNTYAKSKNDIEINYRNLNKCMKDSGFLDLIFIGFKQRNRYDICNDDDTNMMNPKIFEIFDNVTEVELYAVKDYSFSLIRLLSIIKNTKVEKIRISSGFVEGGDSNTWLNLSYFDESSWNNVVQKYQNKGYKIEFDEERTAWRVDQDIYINKK